MDTRFIEMRRIDTAVAVCRHIWKQLPDNSNWPRDEHFRCSICGLTEVVSGHSTIKESYVGANL